MLYTPEEILEMASVYGSLSKIENGYGLIVESQISAIYDMDTSEAYLEGVSDVIETLIAHATAIFKTIMEFISKQADKIDNLINGKKYEQLMTPEMKAKFDELSSGKPVMGIDAAKLYKLQKESEKFIEKFAVTVEGELARAANEPDYDNTKLKNYVDSAQKAYKMINDNIEKVGKTKIPLKKNDFYAMVKQGLNINTDMKSFKKKMAATQKNLTGVLRKLQKSKVLKESADDMLDIFTEGEGFFSKVKEGFMKAITAIKNFVMEHARIAQYVCMCLTVFFGGKTLKRVKGYDSAVKQHMDNDKKIAKAAKYFDDKLMDDIYGKDGELEKLKKAWLKKHPEDTNFEKFNGSRKMLKAQFEILNHGSQKSQEGIAKIKEMKRLNDEEVNRKTKEFSKNMDRAGASAIGAAFFKGLADANDRKKAEEKK